MSAFLNLIALISLITSIVFFVKGFKNKPKFKKATLFFCATWALWFVSAMIDPEPTKVNGKQQNKQEEAEEKKTKVIKTSSAKKIAIKTTERSAKKDDFLQKNPSGKDEKIPTWLIILFSFSLAFLLFSIYKAFIY